MTNELGKDLFQIRELYRRREDYRLQSQSVYGRILAIVRQECGLGKKDKGRAPYIAKAALKKKQRTYKIAGVDRAIDERRFEAIADRATEFWTIYELFLSQKAKYEKKMEEIAARLPGGGFVDAVRGAGIGIYALILAESITVTEEDGELKVACLENYANPAKLWKRFGLAVIDGEGQRRHRDVKKAEKHGFNPKRRAIAFNAGESLMKLNDGEYRAAYEARKVYERTRAEKLGWEVVPPAEITKRKLQGKAISPLHIDRRAKRYMTKLFFKHLWISYREDLAKPDNVVKIA